MIKQGKFIILLSCLLGLVLVAAAGCTSAGTATEAAKAPTGIVLEANGAEISAPLQGEAGVEPREATLKAAVSGNRITVDVSYADSTPLKIGNVWQFDGQKWTRGPFDDTVGILWNIDNSINGFNQKGFDVMTVGLAKDIDCFDFKIVGQNPERGRWPGYTQKGDYWVWCGVPEFYGKGDDNVFACDPSYTKVAGLPAEIRVQNDTAIHDQPWRSNYVVVNGEPRPKYMLKPGLTFDSTPRPYMDQVVEITDYSVFKAGDKVPPLIGIRGAKWGGSKDDLDAHGTNSAGRWQAEFERNLSTGYDDDIQFTKKTSPAYYTFVVIIRDDAKGYAVSAPISLKIAQ